MDLKRRERLECNRMYLRASKKMPVNQGAENVDNYSVRLLNSGSYGRRHAKFDVLGLERARELASISTAESAD